MISALTSLLAGGLSGLIGKGIERWFDHKQKKLELEVEAKRFEHEIALRRVDAELMKEEWAQRTKVAEIEATALVETEDAKAFAVSLDDSPKKFFEGEYSPKQKWLMVFLDFCRGFIRIGLTAYLCILTTVIYIKAEKVLSLDILLPTMAYDLVVMIINTVLYLTTLAVAWQFGSRGSNAPINKGK